MGCNEISWDITKCHGNRVTSGNIKDPNNMERCITYLLLWDMFRDCRTPWNKMGHYETRWDTLGHHGW